MQTRIAGVDFHFLGFLVGLRRVIFRVAVNFVSGLRLYMGPVFGCLQK